MIDETFIRSPSIRREHHSRWAIGIVVAAIVVRLAAAIALGGELHFIDEAIYLDAARRLLSGEGFGATYSNVPAYPVIIAAMAAPWAYDVLLVRCAQAVVAGAACVLVLALGARTFGAAAALIAAVLYALDPLLAVTSGLLYPETIAAVLLLAALLAVWAAVRDDRHVMSAVGGLVLGVLVQCRPVALVLLPVLALWTAWAVAAPRRRRAWHALVLVVCCVVALTPWVVRNVRLHGDVVPAGMAGLKNGPVSTSDIASHGLATALVGGAWRNPLGIARHVMSEFGYFWELYPTRLATDDPAQRQALHRADPRLPVGSSFGTTLRNWASATSFGVELSLALLGVAIAWRRQRVATVLLLAVTLAYALGFALFVAKLRYRITVLPCVLLFAGVGATAIVGVLSGVTRRRRPRA